MKYWLIFTALIITNVIVWAVFSDTFEDDSATISIDDVVKKDGVTVPDLPFEVINPEQIKLQSDKVVSGDPCLISGPLLEDIVASELQRQLLANENVSFEKITEPEQSMYGYRVYLGPIESEELPNVELKLKDVGVDDYFVFDGATSADEAYQDGKYISLVVYGYEPKAKNYASQLNNLGFDSKIKQEAVVLSRRYWLKHALNNEADAELIEKIKGSVKAEYEKLTKSTNIMVDIKPKCPI